MQDPNHTFPPDPKYSASDNRTYTDYKTGKTKSHLDFSRIYGIVFKKRQKIRKM